MSPRFVVQEHAAIHHHHDFRLEVDGILRSWAIPKGPSMNPAKKRLAVQVADHPIEYINFEGVIPRGYYGAGPVVVWDYGTYELIEENKDMIAFNLKGIKLKGSFVLVQIKVKTKSNHWLLIKKNDEYARPDWNIKTSLTSEKKFMLKERIPPC